MKKAPAGCGGNLEGWKRNDSLFAATILRLFLRIDGQQKLNVFNAPKGGQPPNGASRSPPVADSQATIYHVPPLAGLSVISPAPMPERVSYYERS